jgi:hypothetical protein
MGITVKPIENLIGHMVIRKAELEQQIKSAAIPKVLDSYDIERIRGQIKELEHLLEEAWELR